MRRLSKLFVALAVAGTYGCAPEPNELVTGYGDVEIALSVDTTVVAVAGASPLSVGRPQEDISVSAENLTTGYRKSWSSLDDFLSGTGKLPVGKYVFSSLSGDAAAEGFLQKPVFAGSREAHVAEGTWTEVELPCSVSGTYLSLSCGEQVEEVLPGLRLRLKSESGGYVDFDVQERRAARVVSGRIVGELTLTGRSGNSVSLRPFEIAEASDGEHYEFRMNVAGSEGVPELQVVYDEATLAEPWRLTVDDALFAMQPPEIVPFGFDAEGRLSLLERHTPAEPAGCRIVVPGGLKRLYLTVVSETSGDNPWRSETDLVAADAAALAEAGLVAEGCTEGSELVSLDFSGVIARLPAAGNAAAEHRFIVQAEDASGRLSAMPATLTVETLPVVISLGLPQAVALSAETAVVPVSYSGGNVLEDLDFQYKPSYSDDWTTVRAVSVEEKSEGEYLAVVPVVAGADRLSVRACGRNSGKVSNVVVLQRVVPEFTLSCNAENIWSSRADLMVHCDEPVGLVPYLSVLVKESEGEWHPAVVERSVAEGRITVKTLMPQTGYSIAVYAGEAQQALLQITTEPALELPNADFEKWETTISMKNVNCGGKYSNAASWMPIYNKADIEVAEPLDWVSVNRKTCSPYASVSNTWFQVPTTELVGKAYSGQFAVKLRNAAWDMHGVEPARDARTDREYYSSNAPSIANRSAGKLFLGSYSCDAQGRETYDEGIPFSSRPTAVSGMYAYVCGLIDRNETGLVVVRLLHEEDGKSEEIGRGELRLTPSTSFTRFTVPIAYTVRNKRATRLCLMISSSCYSSYSQAEESRLIRTTDYLKPAISTGSELIVDQLSLLYE